MTREEALEILLDEGGHHFTADEVLEHLRKRQEAEEMAIEALKMSSPCDLCKYHPPMMANKNKPCYRCPAKRRTE